MKNLFPSTCSSNPPFPDTSENISSKGVEEPESMALDAFDPFQGKAPSPSSTTHLYSDIYISNLLNGTSTPPSASINDQFYSYNVNLMNMESLTDQGVSHRSTIFKWKERDGYDRDDLLLSVLQPGQWKEFVVMFVGYRASMVSSKL